MIEIKFEGLGDEIRKQTRFLDGVQRRQIPFAERLALNKTARDVQKVQEQEIVRVFKNPIGRTKKGVFTQGAKRSDMRAIVGLKDRFLSGYPADRILSPHILGGQRPLKPSEQMLQRRGILPRGKITVPGHAARRNSRGNIPGGRYQQMLSNLGAQHDARQNIKRGRPTKKKAAIYYVATKNKKPIGIGVQDSRKHSGLFLVFMRQVNYQRRYDFFGIAAKTSARQFPQRFAEALDRALATAR